MREFPAGPIRSDPVSAASVLNLAGWEFRRMGNPARRWNHRRAGLPILHLESKYAGFLRRCAKVERGVFCASSWDFCASLPFRGVIQSPPVDPLAICLATYGEPAASFSNNLPQQPLPALPFVWQPMASWAVGLASFHCRLSIVKCAAAPLPCDAPAPRLTPAGDFSIARVLACLSFGTSD
jgi:hypothetical protein